MGIISSLLGHASEVDATKMQDEYAQALAEGETIESIPYRSITHFSIETTGHFDLEADLKIWIGNDPDPIQKTFTGS